MAGATRYPRYPAYKPSGVDWLGEIPAHWGMRRVKFFGWFQYGDSLPQDAREEGKFSVFGSNGPVGRHSRANTLAPCLVIGRKGSYGKINYSSKPVFAIDTTFFVDSRSARADIRWLYYALPLLGLDTASQDAAVPGLSREFAHNQYLPDVSLEEQRAIVAFLDGQTAVLDQLIQEKRALIGLLQERRAAVISTAVTQGLDPTVPMKESGVEWIGRVPAHWEVTRVKSALEFLDHKRIPLSSEIRGQMEDKKYPYYGASGIIDYVEDYIFEEPLILVAEDGANLYSRSTPLAFVAKGKYWVNNHAHILKPRLGSLDYWTFVLASIVYDPWITGSAQPKLTKDNLGLIALPLPSTNETYSIANYLVAQTAKLDELIAETEASIAALKEYRAALIGAAVTGQIDVCQVALSYTVI